MKNNKEIIKLEENDELIDMIVGYVNDYNLFEAEIDPKMANFKDLVKEGYISLNEVFDSVLSYVMKSGAKEDLHFLLSENPHNHSINFNYVNVLYMIHNNKSDNLIYLIENNYIEINDNFIKSYESRKEQKYFKENESSHIVDTFIFYNKMKKEIEIKERTTKSLKI